MYLKCKQCGWISYKVSRKYAEEQVKSFNDYFKTLTKKRQKEFYGGKGADISGYEKCFRCNASYKDAKKPLKKDIDTIYGSTIQPMIDPKE
jgi:hypothetical protein